MNIVLFTATGAENLGDELITLCEIQSFLAADENTRITLFSHDIERTRRFLLSQKLSLENIMIKEYFPNALKKNTLKNIRLFWETVKIIKNTDHVYIGGGGLFYGKNEEWHSPMRLWWMRASLAKFFKKPLTYLSLGISVKSEDLKDAAKMFFSWNTITLRDTASMDIATELGYSGKILPDPVYNYSPEILGTPSKRIGIALRKGFLPDEVVTQMIKKLMGLWYEILLLPHSLHPTNESSHDGYYLQNFLLPGVETTQSIEQTLEGYKKCHIIIGMRLHSMMLAIDHHVAFIGISYGKKTTQLLTEIGWDYSDDTKIKTDDIVVAIEKIEWEYSALTEKLKAIHTTQKNAYISGFRDLLWK